MLIPTRNVAVGEITLYPSMTTRVSIVVQTDRQHTFSMSWGVRGHLVALRGGKTLTGGGHTCRIGTRVVIREFSLFLLPTPAGAEFPTIPPNAAI